MIEEVLANDPPAIINPVLHPDEREYADVAANPLGPFIARLWWTIVVAGGLALLIFLIWGGLIGL